MFVQMKRAPIVNPHGVEDTLAIQESAVADGNPRLCGFDNASVKPVEFLSRHQLLPACCDRAMACFQAKALVSVSSYSASGSESATIPPPAWK